MHHPFQRAMTELGINISIRDYSPFLLVHVGCNSFKCVNTLGANPTKWSNTLKQFVGNLPTNCLSVFDHFVGLALKGLSF